MPESDLSLEKLLQMLADDRDIQHAGSSECQVHDEVHRGS